MTRAAIKPDYAWAHHVLGRWHHEAASLGVTSRWLVRFLYGGLPAASHTAAIEQLQRAMAIEPEELNHHLELGFAYAAIGDTAEAKINWKHGLQLPSRGKHDESAKQRAHEAMAATP